MERNHEHFTVILKLKQSKQASNLHGNMRPGTLVFRLIQRSQYLYICYQTNVCHSHIYRHKT